RFGDGDHSGCRHSGIRGRAAPHDDVTLAEPAHSVTCPLARRRTVADGRIRSATATTCDGSVTRDTDAPTQASAARALAGDVVALVEPHTLGDRARPSHGVEPSRMAAPDPPPRPYATTR